MYGDGCHPGLHTLNNMQCPCSFGHLSLMKLLAANNLKCSNLCALVCIAVETKVYTSLVGKDKGNEVTATLSRECVPMQFVEYIKTRVAHGQLLRVGLGATKCTHIPIITYNIPITTVLRCKCSPYMCKYFLRWTIWRGPHLSLNQKLMAKSPHPRAVASAPRRKENVR